MKNNLFFLDCLISFCVMLVWVTLLALARRAWLPDLDARLILVTGVLIFGFGVLILTVVQVGSGAVVLPVQMAHRRPSAFWQLVKWGFGTFLFLKVIQIVMVAMGAGQS